MNEVDDQSYSRRTKKPECWVSGKLTIKRMDGRDQREIPRHGCFRSPSLPTTRAVAKSRRGAPRILPKSGMASHRPDM